MDGAVSGATCGTPEKDQIRLMGECLSERIMGVDDVEGHPARRVPVQFPVHPKSRMRHRGARVGICSDQLLAVCAVRKEREAIVGRLKGKSVSEGIASDDADLNGWNQDGISVYTMWIVGRDGSGGHRNA
jgi:hypothetical protein